MTNNKTTCTTVTMYGRAVRTVKSPKTGKLFLCIDDLAIALGFKSTSEFMRTELMRKILEEFKKHRKSDAIAFVYPENRTSETQRVDYLNNDLYYGNTEIE